MGISQAKIELTISESQIEYKLLHATKQKKTSKQLVWWRGAIDYGLDCSRLGTGFIKFNAIATRFHTRTDGLESFVLANIFATFYPVIKLIFLRLGDF